MITLLEQTAEPAGFNWVSLAMIAAMLALLYFFMIRPQKKQEKEVNSMRNSLMVGDEITTIGGITGKVVNIKDDRFVIESGADQVRIEFAKWALSSNDTAAAAAKEKQKREQEAKAKAKAAKRAQKEGK